MKKPLSRHIVTGALFFIGVFLNSSMAFADVRNVDWQQAAIQIGCASEQACRAQYQSADPTTLEGAKQLKDMWSFFDTQKGVYTQAEKTTLAATQKTIIAELASADPENFNEAIIAAAEKVLRENPQLAVKQFGISKQKIREARQEQKSSDALEKAMEEFQCGGGNAEECGRDFETVVANGGDTSVYEQIAKRADEFAGNQLNNPNSYFSQYKKMKDRTNQYVQVLMPSSYKSDIMYRPTGAQKMNMNDMLAFCDQNAPNPVECRRGIEKSFGVVSTNQDGIVDMGNGVYKLGDMLSRNRSDFEKRYQPSNAGCPIVSRASSSFIREGCSYKETSYTYNGLQCKGEEIVCSKDTGLPPYELPCPSGSPIYLNCPAGQYQTTDPNDSSRCPMRQICVDRKPPLICPSVMPRKCAFGETPKPPTMLGTCETACLESYPQPYIDCAGMPATVRADFELSRSGQTIADQGRRDAMAKYASCNMTQPPYPSMAGQVSHTWKTKNGSQFSQILKEAEQDTAFIKSMDDLAGTCNYLNWLPGAGRPESGYKTFGMFTCGDSPYNDTGTVPYGGSDTSCDRITNSADCSKYSCGAWNPTGWNSKTNSMSGRCDYGGSVTGTNGYPTACGQYTASNACTAVPGCAWAATYCYSTNTSSYGTSGFGDTCSKYMSILPGAHMHGGGACVGGDEKSWVYNTDPVAASSVKDACTATVPSGVSVSCPSSSNPNYTTSYPGGSGSQYAGDANSCPWFAYSRWSNGQRYCQLNNERKCDKAYPSYQTNGANYKVENCPAADPDPSTYPVPVSYPPSYSGSGSSGWGCGDPSAQNQVECSKRSCSWLNNACSGPGTYSGTYMPPSTGTYSTDPATACGQGGGTWNASTNYCAMPGMTSGGSASTMPAGGCPIGWMWSGSSCVSTCPSSQYWNGSSCVDNNTASTGTTYTTPTSCPPGYTGTPPNCAMPSGTYTAPTGGTTATMTPDEGCKQTYGSAASWNGSKCVGGTSPTASIIDTLRFWFSRP